MLLNLPYVVISDLVHGEQMPRGSSARLIRKGGTFKIAGYVASSMVSL